MLYRRLKTLAVAVAMTGVVMLAGSRPAAADILVTITDAGGPQTFDDASNTGPFLFTFTGTNYTLTGQTIVTNYPGDGTGGSISTTVNVATLSSSTPGLLTVQVQLVNPTGPPANSNLLWTSPSSTPVTVSATASFDAPPGYLAGVNTVNTYFNSTASTTTLGLGASTVSANQTFNKTGGSPGPNTVSVGNPAGSYTLSQLMTLTALNTNTSSHQFSITADSTVTAVPEPSAMAIAGLGALGMIGYGLRRRKALGA